MMTNANAELAMRVKALEVDVAALQRKLAEVIGVCEALTKDVERVSASARRVF